MPKKFVGENSKAVAARQRKENIKVESDQKKKEILEDEAWKDDDKQILKKQQKKEEQERKRLQMLEKKAEAKALLEKEMDTLKNSVAKVQPPSKVTRAQIAHAAKPQPPAKVQSKVSIVEEPLEENMNRIQLDGEVAQSVDEAITILGGSVADVDKHPEKRMKAAFTAFEENALPRLKAENPTLRLSQLKQMLRKEWLKSPENPLNQKY